MINTYNYVEIKTIQNFNEGICVPLTIKGNSQIS